VSTLAYTFLLVGLLITRQVFKGRVMNLGEDLSDAFIALSTGNTTELQQVLARTGDANTPTVSTIVGASGTVEPGTNDLIIAAEKRGKAAKGYKWTATGPDYYDCSGLMWRAAQDCGFKGVRFTTSTIQLSKQMIEVAEPGTPEHAGLATGAVGDIIVWPGHHMGVITGPNKFYSARNPHSGISEAPIEGFRSGRRKCYRLAVLPQPSQSAKAAAIRKNEAT
jgi:cell wall-associated NlpC family hydrolase